MTLDPQVESWYGHPRTEDPWWNESGWFGFAVPERHINGWFHFMHRPNMGLTAGGVAVWDDRGSDRHDCLFYHWFPFNPLPTNGDMFDFTLSNGMQVQMVDPLREYRLRFNDPKLQLDLRWKGTVEPQVASLAMATSTDIGSFHYDQLGHVEGTLVVDGERIAVDFGHVRDRSWGVRRPFPRELRGGLDMGWAEDGTAFCATMLGMDEPQSESVAVETLAYGHLYKDGVASVAVEGRRETHRRRDGSAERFIVDIKDADGRTVHAEGSPRNNLHYDELWRLDWRLTRWHEINGVPGWGESQDMYPREEFRRLRRRALIENEAVAP